MPFAPKAGCISWVLWSPMLDLTFSGKSMELLDEVDPILSPKVLKHLAKAYVQDSVEFSNLMVSPMFAEYSKKFPRTLIMGGTNDVLRSDWDGFAEKLAKAEVDYQYIIFDPFEHTFMAFLWKRPESKIAREMTLSFMEQ